MGNFLSHDKNVAPTPGRLSMYEKDQANEEAFADVVQQHWHGTKA